MVNQVTVDGQMDGEEQSWKEIYSNIEHFCSEMLPLRLCGFIVTKCERVGRDMMCFKVLDVLIKPPLDSCSICSITLDTLCHIRSGYSSE